MKKYRRQFWIFVVFFICSFSMAQIINAQPTNPGEDVDAPIDGGVSLLLAAGIGYGIKKVKDDRKKKAIEIL